MDRHIAWLACALFVLAGGAAVAAPRQEVRPGARVVAGLAGSTTDAALRTLLEKNGLPEGQPIGASALRVVELPRGATAGEIVARLGQHRELAFVEADAEVESAATVNDPLYAYQSDLSTINAANWLGPTSGPQVTVAILDTGVDATHPDLAGRVVAGWNVVDGTSNTDDVNGHGTAMAGLIAASSSNSVGMAGLCSTCVVMPIRVADSGGHATLSNIAAGLTWAADHGAQLALVSFGGLTQSDTVANAAQYFRAHGGVVFVAEGNAPVLSSGFRNPWLFSVGSSDSAQSPPTDATWGMDLDLTAPMHNVLSTARGGGYAPWTGTSVSAALAAGVAGSVWGRFPQLSPAQLVLTMHRASTQTGYNAVYGFGPLDENAAMSAAQQALSGTDVPVLYMRLAATPLVAAHGHLTVAGSVETFSTPASVGSYSACMTLLDGGSDFAFDMNTACHADGRGKLGVGAQTATASSTLVYDAEYDNNGPSVSASASPNFQPGGPTGTVYVTGSVSQLFAGEVCSWTVSLGGASCRGTGSSINCALDTTGLDGQGNRLVPDGQATIIVQGFDSAGTAKTTSIGGFVMNPFVASITNLVSGDLATGTLPVQVAAAGAGETVASIALYDGSGRLIGSTTSNPGSISWDTTRSTASSLYAVATATDGTTAQSTTLNLRVENPTAAVTLSSPAPGATVAGVTALAFTLSDPFDVSDDLVVDGVVAESGLIPSTQPGSPTQVLAYWSTTGLSDGVHTLSLLRHTRFGTSIASSNGFTLFVDNTPPSIQVVAPASGAVVSGTFRVQLATADGSAARGEVRINGASAGSCQTPCSLNVSTSGLPEGALQLQIVGMDGLSNTSTTLLPLTVKNSSPLLTVTSPVGTLHGLTTLSTSVAGMVAPVSVSYSVNDSPAGSGTDPFSTTFDFTGVANGVSVAVSAIATDANGTTATSERVVTVDNAPPTVTFVAPASSGALVHGSYTVSAKLSDASPLSSVALVIDGSATLSSPPSVVNPAWTLDTTQLSDGSHALAITAVDKWGLSTTATSSIVVDNSAPSASFVSPAAGATIYGTVTVQVSAQDATSGVTSVAFAIDGTSVGSDSTAPYTYTWATSGYASHTLTATAYDKAGNARTISEAVTVDDRAPAVSVTSPVASSWVRGSAAPVQFTIASAAPVTSCSVLVDGSVQTTSSSCSGSLGFDSTKIANGAGHSLAVRATSSNGTTTSSAVSVGVDNEVPVLSLSAPASGGTYGSALPLQFTSSDGFSGLARVTATIDGQVVREDVFSPAQTSDNVSTSLDFGIAGSHTVVLTAVDAAGNSTSTSTNFTTDVQAPAVAIVSPANGAWLRGVTPVQVTASDDVGLSSVQLLEDGSVLATATGAPLSFNLDTTRTADGAHTLTAKAIDLAQNASSVSVSIGVDNTAPVSTFSIPANTALSGMASITIAASDATSGVASVELRVDGTSVGTVNAAPFVFGFDTHSLADGSHTLASVTIDAAGNVFTASETVTVDNTAPALTLVQPASGGYLRGAPTVQFTATDASGSVQVAFAVDGVQLAQLSAAPFDFNWDTTSVADGAHSLTGTATDNAGNRTQVVASVTVDNSAPSEQLVAPSAGSYLAGSQVLSVNATDAIGLGSVRAMVDGVELGTLTSPPFEFAWDTARVADGAHQLSSLATDLAGNSLLVSEQVVADNTPPTVTISAPLNGSYVAGRVAVTVQGADAVALKQVDATVGSQSLGVSAGSPASFVWDSAGVADGTYSISGGAEDRAGNRGQAAASIVVDNTPPSVAITRPAADAAIRGVVTVGSSAGDLGSGVGSVQFAVDGTPFANAAVAPYQADLDTTQLTPGVHALAVTAMDRVGNSASASENITVDNIPPEVTFLSPAPGAWVRQQVAIQLSASDNLTLSSVTLLVDGSAVATLLVPPFQFTLDSTALAQGPHQLTATATDSAGNGTSINQAINVDNIAPSAALDSPANSSRLRGVVAVQGSASDDQGLSTVSLQIDGATVATASSSPVTYSWQTSGAADGSHVVEVVATDLSGNSQRSAATVLVDNTPPAVNLTSPTNGAAIGASATLSATAQDASGIALVDFVLDGATLVGTASAAPYAVAWDASSTPAGAHSITAIAYDTVGNATTSTAASITVDHAAPAVAITSPSAGATVQGTVSVAASASDNTAVARVEFYADGSALIGSSTAAPYTSSWDTTQLKAGTHTVFAKAYDVAGNAASSASVSVNVKDVTAPTVAITSPASGTLVTQNASTTITASASDATGVTKVLFLVNGTQKCSDTTAPFSCSWSVPKGAGVTYSLTAKAYDAANNVATSASVSVTSQ